MFTQLLSSFVPHANVSRPSYDVAQGGVTYEDGGEDYSMAYRLTSAFIPGIMLLRHDTSSKCIST